MSENLKPCPFCNEEVEVCSTESAFGPSYYIKCHKCNREISSLHDNLGDLIYMWNDREERYPPIKSCPLCGDHGEFVQDSDGKWSVSCRGVEEGYGDCICYPTPPMPTIEEAARIWNGEANVKTED